MRDLLPQPLAEPDVILSVYPAHIIQPVGIYPAFECANASSVAAHSLIGFYSPFSPSCKAFCIQAVK